MCNPAVYLYHVSRPSFHWVTYKYDSTEDDHTNRLTRKRCVTHNLQHCEAFYSIIRQTLPALAFSAEWLFSHINKICEFQRSWMLCYNICRQCCVYRKLSKSAVFVFVYSTMRLQKRLAAAVMKCGKNKIWLDPNETNEIANANSSSYMPVNTLVFFVAFGNLDMQQQFSFGTLWFVATLVNCNYCVHLLDNSPKKTTYDLVEW